MPQIEAESELVRRAVAGEEAALKALLTLHYSRLCAYVRRRIPISLQSHVDAEDIVQCAMISVTRKISAFEPRQVDSFGRWITTIAVRELRGCMARHRTVKRGGGIRILSGHARSVEDSMIALLDQLAASDTTPSRCAARVEAVRAMQQALDQLPARQREAIWWVHIEGRSAAEAASAMGRSVRAVYTLCARARQQLREILRTGSRFLSDT